MCFAQWTLVLSYGKVDKRQYLMKPTETRCVLDIILSFQPLLKSHLSRMTDDNYRECTRFQYEVIYNNGDD